MCGCEEGEENVSDKYDEQAAALLRQHFMPLYPDDKPLDEMTPYERQLIKQLTPVVAAALREACETREKLWLEVCGELRWAEHQLDDLRQQVLAEIAHLKAENERLRAEIGYHEAKDVIEQLRALNETLTQQLDAAERERDEARALLKEVPEIIREQITLLAAQDKEKADG